MSEDTQEIEKNPLQDLVQHALDQDYNKANKIFNDVVTIKLNDIMDQEQVKLANHVYNGAEEGEDDEQLELDLDNSDDAGEVDSEGEEELEDEASEEESDIDDELEMEDDELSDDDGEWDEEDGDEEVSS